MPDHQSRVLAAQGSSHGDGHDYDRGSPHLRHRSLRRPIEQRLRTLVEDLSVEHGRCRVLEIGAGHGTFTRALLEAGATVAVSEVSRASADQLARRFAGESRVEVRHDPTGEAVLDSGDYEAVVMISVLHHIPDYLDYVARVSERVAPGGAFFSVQDPLWYPRVGRATHLADRTAFYLWRLGQGEVRRGLATVGRRIRRTYDDAEPSDLVEYHVVRQGVDEAALAEVLRRRFADVGLWTYWSTQSAVWQLLGERTPMRTEFGIEARGRRSPGDE